MSWGISLGGALSKVCCPSASSLRFSRLIAVLCSFSLVEPSFWSKLPKRLLRDHRGRRPPSPETEHRGICVVNRVFLCEFAQFMDPYDSTVLIPCLVKATTSMAPSYHSQAEDKLSVSPSPVSLPSRQNRGQNANPFLFHPPSYSRGTGSRPLSYRSRRVGQRNGSDAQSHREDRETSPGCVKGVAFTI